MTTSAELIQKLDAAKARRVQAQTDLEAAYAAGAEAAADKLLAELAKLDTAVPAIAVGLAAVERAEFLAAKSAAEAQTSETWERARSAQAETHAAIEAALAPALEALREFEIDPAAVLADALSAITDLTWSKITDWVAARVREIPSPKPPRPRNPDGTVMSDLEELAASRRGEL